MMIWLFCFYCLAALLFTGQLFRPWRVSSIANNIIPLAEAISPWTWTMVSRGYNDTLTRPSVLVELYRPKQGPGFYQL